MSLGVDDSARGTSQAESTKLSTAKLPCKAKAATSCALAAISGEGNVPTHILVFLFGSRTSQTHFSPFLCLTPLYIGCRVSLNFFLPAFRLWDKRDDSTSTDDACDGELGLFLGLHGGGWHKQEDEDDEDDKDND
jgi:hypothetical protein